MSPLMNFVVWVVLLAAALFFPVAHLIWVVSVRRLQRREGRELDDTELLGQKQRARLLALFVVLVFSALYNMTRLGLPGATP